MTEAAHTTDLGGPFDALRRSLASEASELSALIEDIIAPTAEIRTAAHVSVHRLAGGLGFFGLQDEGNLARVIDERLSADAELWPINDLLELLLSIERSLQP